MSKKESETNHDLHNLNLLYTFYCKLNQRKMKHRSFDDVHNKSEIMDLHEFMTFCQDFQLTAKQHTNYQRAQKNTNK
jgi:ligand-binding sensor protein